MEAILNEHSLISDELIKKASALKLNNADIARIANKSTATVSQVMRGIYKGRPEVVDEILAALEHVEESSKERQKRKISWMTEGQKIIYSILNLTYYHNGFTAVVGPSGLGKTFTAKHFASQHDDVEYIRCCDGMTTTDTIQLLLDVTHSSHNGNRVQRMNHALRGFKKRDLKMLLVDEADLLVTDPGNKPAILKKIAIFREVKEAGFGVAMIGLESFDDTLRVVGETYVTSRIDYFRRVADPSLEELSDFLENQGWDLSEPDAQQVVSLAPKRGGFRFLEKLSQTGRYLGTLAEALSVSYAAGANYKEG